MQPVNVSAINDYAYCPFRWWAKWVMNYQPAEDSDVLEFGKLLHQVFEAHATGMTMKQAITTKRADWHLKATKESPFSYNCTVALKAIDKLDEMTEPLLLWTDQYTFDDPCLEAEVPFEIEIDDIIYRGRPDRVALRDGMIWHVQTKGLNAATNFGVFTDLAKRSYHEHLYAEALSRKYPDFKYGGTMFNLVRKLKYRTKVTAKKPEGEVKQLTEIFQQFPMSVDLKSPLHTHVMQSMRYWVEQMNEARALWEKRAKIPPPNERANGGYYGNKPDVYFRVLTGEIDLGDLRYFKQREDTYATPMVGEE